MNSPNIFPLFYLLPSPQLSPAGFYSHPTPFSLSVALPNFSDTPAANLSEETKNDAKILFSQGKPLEGNIGLQASQANTCQTSGMDYEIEALKNSILSQSSASPFLAPMSAYSSPRSLFAPVRKPYAESFLRTSATKPLRDSRGVRCSKAERIVKIRKYKDKLKKWRERHPVSRDFGGRRQVAFNKRRVNGRFAKGYLEITEELVTT